VAQYSRLKRLIRERMALTGEAYSVARRAVMAGHSEDKVVEQQVRRMFKDWTPTSLAVGGGWCRTGMRSSP
jgi:hypothetical protein